MEYTDRLLGINKMANNPATVDFSTPPKDELFT